MLPEQWTESGLVAEFRRMHGAMTDRRFAFVLGAGVSVTSGIPAGGSLAWRWLEDLQIRLDARHRSRDVVAWLQAQPDALPGVDPTLPAAFYPQIYEARYGSDPEAGYADLEDVMARAEPAFGYTVLARILAETRHNIVITTNFDNLVADALAVYTRTYPLVCGHERLADFARPHLRRPLVAKIHRDLLLRPHSDQTGTGTLADGWCRALDQLFSVYTPIVIGYGGNDGSLMGYLEGLSRGPGRILWCYRGADGLPPRRVLDLLADKRGVLVRIDGFDELMFRLAEALDYGPVDDQLEAQSRARVERYRERVERAQEAVRARVEEERPAEADPGPLTFSAGEDDDAAVDWLIRGTTELDSLRAAAARFDRPR